MLKLLNQCEVVIMQTAQDIKNALHHLADELPESATWTDVMEKVRFRQAVERGIDAADRGEFASSNDVKNAFARWGVNATS
ncbi:MAG: putative transcriptional regulator [Pseudohongiellaceae bacterium]|jgi:predicted transcriptional regulator